VRSRATAPEPPQRRRSSLRRAIAYAIAIAISFTPTLSAAFERGDRLSHLSDAASASEYWDVVAQFDSGHHLFARFLITNEGPGERTAIATWQLIGPDGKTTGFRNGRRKKRWTLSPSRDRIEIGSSIFDQSGPEHRLEYDSSKRGIRVAFQYAPTPTVASTPTAADGYAIDLLELGTPVAGTIWLEGMAEALSVSGALAITHTWMDTSEADLMLRRIDFVSTGAGPAVFLSDRTAPSGERVRWLVAVREDQESLQTTDFELSLSDPLNNKRGDYPTPRAFEISGDAARGAIENSTVLSEVDPLEEIPQPFRFLLSFKLRPHRVWARASFEVRLMPGAETPETKLKGSGVSTITFTNPLPQ
jgi:hypothetical protein